MTVGVDSATRGTQVRIQSSATFIELLIVCRKDKNKEKEGWNGPFKKKFNGSQHLKRRRSFHLKGQLNLSFTVEEIFRANMQVLKLFAINYCWHMRF